MPAGTPTAQSLVGRRRLSRWGRLLIGALALAAFLLQGSFDPALATVVLIVAVGCLVAGVVGPELTSRSLELTATGPPTATVGREVVFTVTASVRGGGPVRARLLDPTGAWTWLVPGEPVAVRRRADRRGPLAGVRIEVVAAGPLGVVDRGRVRVVPLDRVQHVGPRPLRVTPALVFPGRPQQDGPTARVTGGGDVVRSVRPYVPGDAAHLVHWPTTARLGTVVVRELEPPAERRLAVVVDLRDLRHQGEAVVSLAAGLVRVALGQGVTVLLATCDQGRPSVVVVGSPAALARTLARAVPGPPGTPPDEVPVLEARRTWAAGVRAHVHPDDVALVDAASFPGWGAVGWPVHAAMATP